MDVRVEAVVCTADVVLNEITLQVASAANVIVKTLNTIRFSLAPVISIGGNSISAVTPTNLLIGVKAA